MNSRIIYLVGSSGHPNFGDEFIAAAWLKYLAVARPDADVWLDSPQPGMAQVLFEGMHPRLRVTNTLWRLVHDNAELPAEVAAKNIRERVAGFGTPAYDLGILKLREAGSCISSAAATSMTPGRTTPASSSACAPSVKLTGAKLYATGQGLMPALLRPPPKLPCSGVSITLTPGTRPAPTHTGWNWAWTTRSWASPGKSARNDAPRRAVRLHPERHGGSRTLPGRRRTGTHRGAKPPAAEGVKAYYVEAIPGVDHAAYERLADLIPETRFIPFSQRLDRRPSALRPADLGHQPLPHPPAGGSRGCPRHRRRREKGLLRRQARVRGGSGERLVAGPRRATLPQCREHPGRAGGDNLPALLGTET